MSPARAWLGWGGRPPPRPPLSDLDIPTFCPKFKCLKKSPKNRPPFHIFWDPTNPQKIDPRRIFRGLGRGPKKGTPSRGPKSEILPLFTTLELGPASQKGTPFWVYFGELFSQKNEKRGFLKRPKNQSQKTFKMGPKQGGGLNHDFWSFF